MRRRRKPLLKRPPLEADPILNLWGIEIRASQYHLECKRRMDRLDALPPEMRKAVHESRGGLSSFIHSIYQDAGQYSPEALKIIAKLEVKYAQDYQHCMANGGHFKPRITYRRVSTAKLRKIRELKSIAADTEDLLK